MNLLAYPSSTSGISRQAFLLEPSQKTVYLGDDGSHAHYRRSLFYAPTAFGI